MTLTWPAGVGATGYNIKRALVTGGPYTVIGTAAASPYVDHTAVNGTAYYYVVSSTNACGESAGNSIESHGTPNIMDVYGNIYHEVTAEDGRVWLDRNLGATEVATSKIDAASYGYLYQWGRLNDGHQFIASGTTGVQSVGDVPGNANFIIGFIDWRNPKNDNLWQGVNGVNNPCPAGYRLPTIAEWGILIAAAGIMDDNTAYASKLKLPQAGFRDPNTGVITDSGTFGVCWSSDVALTSALGWYFTTSGFSPGFSFSRAYGMSVRCIKN